MRWVKDIHAFCPCFRGTQSRSDIELQVVEYGDCEEGEEAVEYHLIVGGYRDGVRLELSLGDVKGLRSLVDQLLKYSKVVGLPT